MRSIPLAMVLVSLLAAACSSAEPMVPPDPPPAATSPVAAAKTDASATYPAFAPTMPVLVSKGGAVLDHPTAVVVTWDDDPNREAFETLVDGLGATPYWSSIVGEYGVAALAAGAANHVHVTDAIPIADTGAKGDALGGVLDWVAARAADPQSGWPAPTSQTIYTLFLGGANAAPLCDQGFYGVHDSVSVGGKGGQEVAVAVILECGDDPGLDRLQSATVSASHELAEAAVDPQPDARPGWQGLRPQDLDWELMQDNQDENADMCELYDDVYAPAAAPAMPFMLQRQWSNASAAAGHSPCVPAKAEPYFNVAILGERETLAASFGSKSTARDSQGAGFLLQIDQSKSIDLGFISDAPTDAIEVEAFESGLFDTKGYALAPASPPVLDVALDKHAGKNGDHVALSVTAHNTLAHGVTLVIVKTKIGNTTHYMPILVGTPASATTK